MRRSTIITRFAVEAGFLEPNQAKKLEKEYDPTNRTEAVRMLEEAIRRNWLITGLIYIDPDSPTIFDMYSLGEGPMNREKSENLRPDRKSLELINLNYK